MVNVVIEFTAGFYEQYLLMSFMIFCSISLLQGLALLNQTPQIKQKVLCLQILSWIITLTITMLMFKRPLMR